jgi:CRISPR-associated protein Cas2
MTYLICYDITDDRIRLQLSKKLERAGCVRLQKSVFLAPNFDQKRLIILRGGILRLLSTYMLSIDESILAIPIEKDNTNDMVWAGNATSISDVLKKYLFKLL